MIRGSNIYHRDTEFTENIEQEKMEITEILILISSLLPLLPPVQKMISVNSVSLW